VEKVDTEKEALYELTLDGDDAHGDFDALDKFLYGGGDAMDTADLMDEKA
jgi:hypothetical protein